MIRLVFVLLVLVVVLLAAYCGLQMFASEETRIRWLVEDATTSFNNTSLSGCIEAFDLCAEEFSDLICGGDPFCSFFVRETSAFRVQGAAPTGTRQPRASTDPRRDSGAKRAR